MAMSAAAAVAEAHLRGLGACRRDPAGDAVAGSSGTNNNGAREGSLGEGETFSS